MSSDRPAPCQHPLAPLCAARGFRGVPRSRGGRPKRTPGQCLPDNLHRATAQPQLNALARGRRESGLRNRWNSRAALLDGPARAVRTDRWSPPRWTRCGMRDGSWRVASPDDDPAGHTDADRHAVFALGLQEETVWFGQAEISADEVGEMGQEAGSVSEPRRTRGSRLARARRACLTTPAPGRSSIAPSSTPASSSSPPADLVGTSGLPTRGVHETVHPTSSGCGVPRRPVVRITRYGAGPPREDYRFAPGSRSKTFVGPGFCICSKGEEPSGGRNTATSTGLLAGVPLTPVVADCRFLGKGGRLAVRGDYAAPIAEGQPRRWRRFGRRLGQA